MTATAPASGTMEDAAPVETATHTLPPSASVIQAFCGLATLQSVRYMGESHCPIESIETFTLPGAARSHLACFPVAGPDYFFVLNITIIIIILMKVALASGICL